MQIFTQLHIVPKCDTRGYVYALNHVSFVQPVHVSQSLLNEHSSLSLEQILKLFDGKLRRTST